MRWRSVTDVRTRGATERSDRPEVAVPAPRRPADPPPEVADGVELSRLLALAWLSPAQALELGSGLLAAVARRTDPDAGTPGSDGAAGDGVAGDGAAGGGAAGDRVTTGRLTSDRVVVGTDGRVVLRPDAHPRRDGDPPAGDPAAADAAAVLADIAHAARLRARRADPAAHQLLAELDRAVAELPVAGVPAVARTLGEAAAGADAVRAELGALVRALGGQLRGGAAGAPSGGARPATAARAATAGHRNTGRRIGAWLLSLLVLGGVGLLEVAVLGDKVTADIDVLLDAGRNGSTPSAAAEPDGLPIVPPAPAAAGGVRGVDLRFLDQCAPGAPCTTRVLVRVAPAAGPQVVTWSYRVVDRCTGAVVPAPGGSVTVPAGGEQVAAVGTVPLPPAQAVGVLAVTEVPAVAASAPVVVGSCGAPAGTG
jgi:hypothetical protein